MSRIIVLATLALIHCWSSTQLVLATENARRAPTGMPPATWGSHEIRSSSLPMGRWLDSDQCFDSFGQNSAVAMDPWATGTSDQHPTFRVEAVARAAGNSSRDSRHFDLWVDGKIIASSESTGSGVGCTEEAGSHAMGHAMGHRFHAAAAHELYSDCLTATPRVARLTADLPASAKYWALIPAESQCTHTKFRWSASFKNQCGGGTWRMPRDPVTGELIRASTPGAVAACAAIGGKLADVDWKNLIKVSEVAVSCLGPGGTALVGSWNGDDHGLGASQIYLSSDPKTAGVLSIPDGADHPVLCHFSPVVDTIYGQQGSSPYRLIVAPTPIPHSQAAATCQRYGYTMAAADATNQALLRILADYNGKAATAWVAPAAAIKCPALVVQGMHSVHRNPAEATSAGIVTERECETDKLAAVACIDATV